MSKVSFNFAFYKTLNRLLSFLPVLLIMPCNNILTFFTCVLPQIQRFSSFIGWFISLGSVSIYWIHCAFWEGYSLSFSYIVLFSDRLVFLSWSTQRCFLELLFQLGDLLYSLKNHWISPSYYWDILFIINSRCFLINLFSLLQFMILNSL